jgi:hypothetical protein
MSPADQAHGSDKGFDLQIDYDLDGVISSATEQLVSATNLVEGNMVRHQVGEVEAASGHKVDALDDIREYFARPGAVCDDDVWQAAVHQGPLEGEHCLAMGHPEDHGRALDLDQLEDLVAGLRQAARFDDDVGHGPAGKLLHALDHVLSRGVYRVGRADLLGQREPRVDNVRDDDLAGAATSEQVRETEADRPLTDDDDRLAEDAAQLLDGVDYGADGLTQDG